MSQASPLSGKTPMPLASMNAEQRRIYDAVVADPGASIAVLAGELGCTTHRLYIHLPVLVRGGRVRQDGRAWHPTTPPAR